MNTRNTSGSQSMRASLIWAGISTLGWAVVSIRFLDPPMPLKDVAIMAIPFFAVLFVSMRATNRLSLAVARRVEARAARNAPPPKAPPVPSSERPDHAQRRRTARRPRGGRR